MADLLLLLLGAATALSLVGMGVTWSVATRAGRRQQAALETALAARQSELEAARAERERLEGQLAALWEIDSLRLARRYAEAKQALDGRLAGFETQLRKLGERRLEAVQHLAELRADDPSRHQEVERLRIDVVRVQQESTRLEQILQNLSEVGSIPVQDVKDALARRRQRRVEILQRIERLTAEGSAREAEILRLEGEQQQIRASEAALEREQEVVRSATLVLDNLLGITGEVQGRLAELDAQVSSSLRALTATRATNPLEAVLRASRRAIAPATSPPRAAPAPPAPGPAATPQTNGIAGSPSEAAAAAALAASQF